MQLHQVLVSASHGDAVTNSALHVRALLRQLGESEIYSLHMEPSLAGEVLPLSALSSRPGRERRRDVIIYHASIGQQSVFELVASVPERLVVFYHNISPVDAFSSYDPGFAKLLSDGRRQLRDLAPRTTLAIALSQFSAADMEKMGYQNVKVVPLPVDLLPLATVEPHQPTLNHLVNATGHPVVLFVGQLLPHKRPDLLVEAAYVLANEVAPGATTVLVGASRLPSYRAVLERFVADLPGSGVWLTGHVPVAELAAFYTGADVFCTMSEHEGFCAPLIEATSFGLPVVARPFGAVPETLSGSGVLLPPDAGPRLVAEVLARVGGDVNLGSAIAGHQAEAMSRFTLEQSQKMLMVQLEPLLA
ncbi:MAG: glycosyltransferase family 4 protein [Acidimicrobiales bacterium]